MTPCGDGNKKGAQQAERLSNIGADERSRTSDLRITNALLYQLSYIGESGILAENDACCMELTGQVSESAQMFLAHPQAYKPSLLDGSGDKPPEPGTVL